jgi:hypothetical protein
VVTLYHLTIELGTKVSTGTSVMEVVKNCPETRPNFSGRTPGTSILAFPFSSLIKLCNEVITPVQCIAQNCYVTIFLESTCAGIAVTSEI